MKQTMHPTSQVPQSSTVESSSRSLRQTGADGRAPGHLAQLAATINQSSRVQAQLKLAEELQGSAAPAQRAPKKEKLAQKIDDKKKKPGQLQADPKKKKPGQLQVNKKEKPKQMKFAGSLAVAQLEEAPATNRTGLPDQLKAGVESLSGLSLDDVKVHYNSSKPAQLNALAYAQGTDIHVAPGQEQHLPHEAWHIVQQKQERVQPTTQMKVGTPINDDPALEKEADVMGARALAGVAQLQSQPAEQGPLQLMRKDFGAEVTKTYYAAQIESTGTEGALEGLAQSQSQDSGVFLSDEINEWHEIWVLGKGWGEDKLRVVLPDIEYFLEHEDQIPQKLSQNGLTITENCRLVAEHELIHLRQARQNFLGKNEGAPPGAETASRFFTDEEFNNTISMLRGLTENLDLKLGMKVTRLAGPVDYITKRIEYINNTKKKKNKNAEAPAVIRELRSYLEVSNLKAESDRFAKLYETIVEIDEDCKISLGLKKEEKKCFLTTACISSRGLSDNCEELTVLRAFRDGYMRSVPEGPALIDRYYAIAPGIVEAINKRPNRKEIYDGIYATIRLCLEAIYKGVHPLALETYKSMVTRLSHGFGCDLT